MPKAPILNRECFYEKLGDGSLRLLDWNLVNTSLGAMIEPRQVSAVNNSNRVVHVDLVDTSFNRITELKEDEFYKLFNTGGRQIPVDFRY